MDQIDRKILAELQNDARLTLTVLADRIGLSLSPCHRRVHALEKSGAIQGYRACIDYRKLGLAFSAIVFVTLSESNKQLVQGFEEALLTIPEVISAERLFGTPDYILHIITKDLSSFQKLYDEQLSSLASVKKLTSTIVMKDIFQGRKASYPTF